MNFPVQDTIYPDGWEAPWANWSYAWNAALASICNTTPRYAPTAAVGDDIGRYGSQLARTHVAADAAIVWPPSFFPAGAHQSRLRCLRRRDDGHAARLQRARDYVHDD